MAFIIYRNTNMPRRYPLLFSGTIQKRSTTELMFAEYLQKVRGRLEMTQQQLATKLNLSSEEFSSIDAVTISRWERGVTTPSLSKQFRILRCLDTNLMPYIDSLNNPHHEDKLDELLHIRFEDFNIQLSTASYEINHVSNRQLNIEEVPLLDSLEDNTIDNIKYLHSVLRNGYPGIFDINLYEYLRDKKLIGKKFIDTSNGSLIGHSLSFIFSLNFIENSANRSSIAVDIGQAIRYSPNKPLSCLNAVRFSSSPEVFKLQFSSQLKNLATHSNVHKYYIHIEHTEAYNFMTNLGFDLIAYDSQVSKNGCKIGNKHYSRVLLGIDSSLLLSNKELLTMLKNTL